MARAAQESELPAIDAFVRVVGDGIVARGSAGAVAGLVAALAADLAAQVETSSGEWNERGGVLAQADAIRDRAISLVSEVQRTYRAALSELARARTTTAHETSGDAELAQALNDVADHLVLIGEVANDAAELAELAARSGQPSMRADAIAATILAAAAAEIATHLVDVNLVVTREDPRAVLVGELQLSAIAARNRATSIAL
jgi:formiminotetrahydrofolate cyclodeaminase